jgi:hypothetical protein
VDEKIKAVKALVDSRAHLREEVDHYTKKLSEIEPGAGADPVEACGLKEAEMRSALEPAARAAAAAVASAGLRVPSRARRSTDGGAARSARLAADHAPRGASAGSRSPYRSPLMVAPFG